ncbi:MAG: formyltransferase family protein [Polyangiaceae bacterium]
MAQLLYGHGANILDSDQHTDPLAQMFFQRIRFDLSELITDRGTLERALQEVAQRFQLSYRLAYSERPKRLAIYVSKYEHCLYDLLLRHRAREFSCEIPLIISNHPDLEHVAREFGFEFALIEKKAANKDEAEAREQALLEEKQVDLVVLARYMQIMSEDFTKRWEGRLNQHPPLLLACVRRRQAVPPSLRARREADRRHGALRHGRAR